MTKKTTFLISIMSILFCASCTFKDAELKTETITIPELTDSTYWNYSSVFNKVDYVILESNPNALIGNIQQMEITNDDHFIVFDRRNRAIKRFDKEGHYCNEIGVLGHSHNEYINPERIAYDPHEDKILVWDAASMNLLYYTQEGSFCSKLHLDFHIQGLRVIGRNQYLVYFNYLKTGNGYNYWIISDKGEILSQFESIPTELKFSVYPDPSGVFSMSDDSWLCLSPYSSKVHAVSESGIRHAFDIVSTHPSLVIDSPENIQNTMKEAKFNMIMNFNRVGKTTIIQLMLSSRLYMFIKNSKEEVFAGYIPRNDINGPDILGTQRAIKGNKIYKTTEPSSFSDMYENIKQDTTIPASLKELYRKYSENSNPIIQVCTLKD